MRYIFVPAVKTLLSSANAINNIFFTFGTSLCCPQFRMLILYIVIIIIYFAQANKLTVKINEQVRQGLGQLLYT